MKLLPLRKVLARMDLISSHLLRIVPESGDICGLRLPNRKSASRPGALPPPLSVKSDYGALDLYSLTDTSLMYQYFSGRFPFPFTVFRPFFVARHVGHTICGIALGQVSTANGRSCPSFIPGPTEPATGLL